MQYLKVVVITLFLFPKISLSQFGLPEKINTIIPTGFEIEKQSSTSNNINYSNGDGQFISIVPIYNLNTCWGFQEKKILLTNQVENTLLVRFDDGNKLKMLNKNIRFPYAEKIMIQNDYWVADQNFAVFCYSNRNYILSVSTLYSSLKDIKSDKRTIKAKELTTSVFLDVALKIFKLD